MDCSEAQSGRPIESPSQDAVEVSDKACEHSCSDALLAAPRPFLAFLLDDLFASALGAAAAGLGATAASSLMSSCPAATASCCERKSAISTKRRTWREKSNHEFGMRSKRVSNSIRLLEGRTSWRKPPSSWSKWSKRFRLSAKARRAKKATGLTSPVLVILHSNVKECIPADMSDRAIISSDRTPHPRQSNSASQSMCWMLKSRSTRAESSKRKVWSFSCGDSVDQCFITASRSTAGGTMAAPERLALSTAAARRAAIGSLPPKELVLPLWGWGVGAGGRSLGTRRRRPSKPDLV
mmetsp:Transcript_129719/g.276776  ORF Transcript_129719/g.276776 Transcript_129719/m.276776 type:complete len:295 (-) Transcript_129719:15-899(-)